MTAYPSQTLPITLTTLSQLCAALWDSRSRPVVIQPGIEPGSVVTPLALRCSALDQICIAKLQQQGNYYCSPIDYNLKETINECV